MQYNATPNTHGLIFWSSKEQMRIDDACNLQVNLCKC